MKRVSGVDMAGRVAEEQREKELRRHKGDRKVKVLGD